jgi:hypothetical protein
MWQRLATSFAVLFGLPLACGPTLATPLDPALQQQLLALYDQYDKAIISGKFADIAALRTAEGRAEWLAEVKKTRKQQADDLDMARQMVPDRVQPLHATLSGDGATATIITLASKTLPTNVHLNNGLKPGAVTKSELTLTFAREGQQWKLADLTFGIDPADLKPCKDEATETIAAYDQDRDVSLGGPIRRVEFKPDHTLLVIQMVNEENCAILPNREGLVKLGMNPDLLVPYAIVEMGGSPHKTDKQRAWIEKLRVLAD